ncbi:hypothetical protein ACFZAV_20005 [Streptomyces sp. NPDC008343]
MATRTDKDAGHILDGDQEFPLRCGGVGRAGGTQTRRTRAGYR